MSIRIRFNSSLPLPPKKIYFVYKSKKKIGKHVAKEIRLLLKVLAYTSLTTFHVYDYATAKGIYEKECSVQRSVSYCERIFTNCCLRFIPRSLMPY